MVRGRGFQPYWSRVYLEEDGIISQPNQPMLDRVTLLEGEGLHAND
jgi:hypothetical protein